MNKTIADLTAGQQGTVLGFTAEASAYRQKLLAMGLIKGTAFQVARIAPMGDPVEIKVRDYFLSLRKDEAQSLRIKEHAR